jgi:ribosomal protein S19|uniref:Ribosomal protein S19 n=1 Tax=Trieres regia TaxID=1335017 RepID=A0A7T4WR84_9STRA|nr:ribosomal protein S19 [Odontella regia]QQD79318.1 ribosomal protein S19 [Odontella regia]
MSRAKWKGLDVSNLFLSNLNKQTNTRLSRNITLVPTLCNSFFYIHNGQSYVKVKMTRDMINHKMGCFVATRKTFGFKKKKK